MKINFPVDFDKMTKKCNKGDGGISCIVGLL